MYIMAISHLELRLTLGVGVLVAALLGVGDIERKACWAAAAHRLDILLIIAC